MSVGETKPAARNNLEWALDETEKVENRLQDVLKPHSYAVYLLLAMVPNATRRMFTEIQAQTPQDHAAAFLASRLFTDALATFMLLQKGLVVQTATLLRGAVESTAQAVAFLRNADMAANWLNGRQYTPSQIRKALGGDPDFSGLYSFLSGIAHANPNAKWDIVFHFQT